MVPAATSWMRWRVRLGYPVALVCIWLAHPSTRSLVAGAAVAFLGLLLRAAAAGHLRKAEQLATSGPYAFTRHPLYLGSAILAAGFALGSRSWIAATLVAAYFLAFYPAVMRREEDELRVGYGAAFDAWTACVPRFWPRLSASREGHAARANFSWATYRANREYQAVLGFLLAIGALVLRMYWNR